MLHVNVLIRYWSQLQVLTCHCQKKRGTNPGHQFQERHFNVNFKIKSLSIFQWNFPFFCVLVACFRIGRTSLSRRNPVQLLISSVKLGTFRSTQNFSRMKLLFFQNLSLYGLCLINFTYKTARHLFKVKLYPEKWTTNDFYGWKSWKGEVNHCEPKYNSQTFKTKESFEQLFNYSQVNAH